MGKRRWNMGYRFNMLTKRAYAEAGLGKGPDGKHNNIPLFSKTYMGNFNDISFEKTRDFNFVGLIRHAEGVHTQRLWILDFAKKQPIALALFAGVHLGHGPRHNLALPRTGWLV